MLALFLCNNKNAITIRPAAWSLGPYTPPPANYAVRPEHPLMARSTSPVRKTMQLARDELSTSRSLPLLPSARPQTHAASGRRTGAVLPPLSVTQVLNRAQVARKLSPGARLAMEHARRSQLRPRARGYSAHANEPIVLRAEYQWTGRHWIPPPPRPPQWRPPWNGQCSGLRSGSGAKVLDQCAAIPFRLPAAAPRYRLRLLSYHYLCHLSTITTFDHPYLSLPQVHPRLDRAQRVR